MLWSLVPDVLACVVVESFCVTGVEALLKTSVARVEVSGIDTG